LSSREGELNLEIFRKQLSIFKTGWKFFIKTIEKWFYEMFKIFQSRNNKLKLMYSIRSRAKAIDWNQKVFQINQKSIE